MKYGERYWHLQYLQQTVVLEKNNIKEKRWEDYGAGVL